MEQEKEKHIRKSVLLDHLYKYSTPNNKVETLIRQADGYEYGIALLE